MIESGRGLKIDISALSQADKDARARNRYIVTERLSLTRDGRVVPEAECARGNLLFTKGQEISLGEARRYGLVAEEKPVELVAEVTPTPIVAETPPALRRRK